jgi:type I restriction enzyme S subunit
MECEWETLPVAEAPLDIIDGDRGVNYPKQEDFASSGDCLFLNTGNVTTTGFSFTDRSFITKEKDAMLRKGKLQRHDVVLTTRGTVGNVALFDDSVPFEHVRINSGMVLLRANQSKLLPRFLYLFVRSQIFKEQVAALSTGSAQPQLPIRDIRRIELPIPPLPEQKNIAAILGALDDKIELNRRMNATMEAMARALFKSWFVDFDPVRAKLDGRPPTGLDPETAALFPATFQDSPLGHIPQGWEVKTVGEIGNVVCGKTPSTAVSDYYGNDIPFITIPDMHGSVFAASTGRRLTHAGADSQANKTLPPGSICVSCIATPGLVVITSENSQTNQQINSVVPHQCDESYFWYWVMTGLGAEIASSGSGGSVLANLSKGRFETLQVINPPHALIRAYHSSVSPLFENILANTRQSRTLATLRDTLLPKLLSGELSVAAQKEVCP